MFRDILTNRLFIGALAIFIFCVGGSLLYKWHVDRQGAEYQKETEARVEQSNERQKEQPTAEVPVEQPAAVEDFHEDGTFHAEPHEPIAAPSEVSEPEVSVEVPPAPQIEYNRGMGNPPPFDKVPVDLYDFEATKAVMIKNINFVKANWDPKIYFDKDLGREMRIARAISENIANATMLGIYTREQGRELRGLHSSLLDFKGIDGERLSQLKREGHTNAEAIEIASKELLQRWGVE